MTILFVILFVCYQNWPFVLNPIAGILPYSCVVVFSILFFSLGLLCLVSLLLAFLESLLLFLFLRISIFNFWKTSMFHERGFILCLYWVFGIWKCSRILYPSSKFPCSEVPVFNTSIYLSLGPTNVLTQFLLSILYLDKTAGPSISSYFYHYMGCHLPSNVFTEPFT